MELHGVHRAPRPDRLGEDRRQMLDLNRRLEAYLNRLRLLEEENALLAQEVQAARRGGRGAPALRRSLEEELRRARLEVQAAWRDRLVAELEVGRLAEELRALDLQTQLEARARAEAKAKLELGRKQLEEEQRAQVWLRGQASQLEHEMRLLVQTHQDGVARLEAELTRVTAAVPRTPAPRAERTPGLLQLGQEFSHRAGRAWREAAEAHRGRLARLEEALHQTGGRLAQAEQDRRDGRLKLRALEEEAASAQEARQRLEQAAAQQRVEHEQEIQQLHERWQDLEAEKEEMGQQMERLLLENRGLLQMKTSLGLEVATYRALLDGDGFRGDVRRFNQTQNSSTADAVFSPRGVKKNYQIQLSGGYRTTSFQSAGCITEPTVTSLTPICRRTPAAPHATGATQENPYPKILQGEAVESFRPQQVDEKVTHAEPLSPADELESTASGSREEEERHDNVETPAVESLVTGQVESGLGNEPPFNDEVDYRQFTTSSLMPGEPCGVSGKSAKKVAFEGPAEEEDAAAEEEDTPQLHAPVEAWVEKQTENEQEEDSDSETEAMLEPTCESRTSSPESECVSEEIVTEFNLDENAGDIRQKVRSSTAGTNETDVDDKLYPDGEEMDTWDSVIERKVSLKTGEGMKTDEGKRQRAEPEEDISEHKKGDFRQQFVRDVQQEDDAAPSQTVPTQVDDEQLNVLERESALLSDKDEDDDSQNVSVSWRTELEGDSYAQDNTLADTRPLIRYKSDETDANTQASHMEESESSDGEQDRKAKELGMGTWTEDKSKRFGTMEDLCEEIEGEMTDEQYCLGYTRTEETDAGPGSAAWEKPILMSDTEIAEHMVRKENEKQSEVETEKLIYPINIDYDEELETDRLVEQELENLTTDSYSARFAEREVHEETLHVRGEQDITKPQDAEETIPQHMHGVQSGKSNNEGLVPSSAISSQMSENLYSTQHNDHEPGETPEKREQEHELNASAVTHSDITETQSGFIDRFLEREDSKSLLLIAADQTNNPDVTDHAEVEEEVEVKHHQELSDNLQQPEQGNAEESKESQEKPVEDVECCPEQPQQGNTAEASKQSQEQLVGDLPSSVELSDTVQMEASEKWRDQAGEDAADSQELSSNLRQPQLDDALKASETSKSSEESQEEPAEDAAERQEQQPPVDDFMEALRKSEDELVEEVPDCWDLSSSFESQVENMPDTSKEAEDEHLQEDVDRQEDVLMEALKKPEEHRTEDVADWRDFPEAPETAEWEVPEVQDWTKTNQKREPEVRSNDEEPLKASSDRVPGEQDIFMLKEATDFFPSAVKSDFWVSSLEGGATFQPDAATHANQKTGLSGSTIWGSSENQNVVNGNSRADAVSLESQAAKKDQKEKQMLAEVKEALCKNVLEGEPVHSEESEVEGESWSSEE